LTFYETINTRFRERRYGMKKLVVLILIGAAGLVAYNYYTTGEISLIPSSSLSEEERELKQLEKVFHKAQNEIIQASRAASITGLDTPSDVTGAMREIERVEQALIGLKKRISSERAKTTVERLLSEIRAFKKAHD
jgi:predicted negative regulator of RcsB-dependent stress response